MSVGIQVGFTSTDNTFYCLLCYWTLGMATEHPEVLYKFIRAVTIALQGSDCLVMEQLSDITPLPFQSTTTKSFVVLIYPVLFW